MYRTCAGVVAVQAALQSVFPSCSDLSDDSQRGITAFTPHLSLGQWRKKQELLEALQVNMRPTAFVMAPGL